MYLSFPHICLCFFLLFSRSAVNDAYHHLFSMYHQLYLQKFKSFVLVFIFLFFMAHHLHSFYEHGFFPSKNKQKGKHDQISPLLSNSGSKYYEFYILELFISFSTKPAHQICCDCYSRDDLSNFFY